VKCIDRLLVFTHALRLAPKSSLQGQAIWPNTTSLRQDIKTFLLPFTSDQRIRQNESINLQIPVQV